MADNAKLIAQIRALILLTQTEQQVAETRVVQATTEAVRRELIQNAQHASERTETLIKELRDLGGIPDVVTPLVGRVGALAKATLEQAAPLDEALLSDLSLEHQLRDRAVYLKVLAGTAENARVTKLADRLIVAHSATVEWLTTVLAEEALGGPAALRATPIQRLAGGATRAANLPAHYAAEGVNRTVDTVNTTTEQARTKVLSATAKATQVGGIVKDALATGRQATLGRAEKLARRDGNKAAAKEIHETRRDLGALTESELPIKKYDDLSITQAATATKKLTTAEDIRAVMRYEQTHKNRASVLSATQAQLATVAQGSSRHHQLVHAAPVAFRQGPADQSGRVAPSS